MKIHPALFVLSIVVTLLVGVLMGTVLDFKSSPITLFPKSCNYNGQTYKSGASFRSTDGCNTCGCQNGQVACTEMFCVNNK